MLSTFLARYDTEALRPPPTPDTPADRRTWSALQQDVQRRVMAWCRRGGGDGVVPLLQPWDQPWIEQPFAVAELTRSLGADTDAVVQDLALQLDGTWTMLAAGGRWSQRLLRLRVKWGECLWWRRRAGDAPWDCGYLDDRPDALSALARFKPRRPTLVITQGLSSFSLQQAVQALTERQRSFRHPVRLLVVA